MATSEDEIRRRERSGQRSHSYFPAANQYAGAPAYIQQAAMRNLAAGAGPTANYNRLQGIQTFGYDRNLSQQNAAIAQSMARTPADQAMTTYQLPTGGTASIPTGQAPPPGYGVASSYGGTSPAAAANIPGAQFVGGAGRVALPGASTTLGGIQAPNFGGPTDLYNQPQAQQWGGRPLSNLVNLSRPGLPSAQPQPPWLTGAGLGIRNFLGDVRSGQQNLWGGLGGYVGQFYHGLFGQSAPPPKPRRYYDPNNPNY